MKLDKNYCDPVDLSQIIRRLNDIKLFTRIEQTNYHFQRTN